MRNIYFKTATHVASVGRKTQVHMTQVLLIFMRCFNGFD